MRSVANYVKIVFDGDALNFTPLIEKNLTNLFKTLGPQFSNPDPNKPFGISSFLTLLSPGHSTMANYLLDKEEQPELDTIVNHL